MAEPLSSHAGAEAALFEGAAAGQQAGPVGAWARGTGPLTAVTAADAQRFEAAVANYGLQLRAWIDAQVDLRLQQALPGLLGAELSGTRRDCAVALQVAERVEGEGRAVAEAQAKLLAVVEGISDELARLKAALAACQLGLQLQSAAAGNDVAGEEALAQIQKVRHTVDELKRCITAREHQDAGIEIVRANLERHSEALAEVRRASEQALAAAAAEQRRASQAAAEGVQALEAGQQRLREDARRLQQEVAALDRRSKELRASETVKQSPDDVRDVATWVERRLENECRRVEARRREEIDASFLVHSEMEAWVQTRLEAFRAEASHSTVVLRGEWETKLSGFRAELEACVETHVEALKLDKRLAALRADLEDHIDGQLRVRLEALRVESQQATKGQIAESHSRIGEDLAAMQQRLAAELRAETTQALGREAAAVAALDEQLWITDRRLGQRIDELAHLHLRERVALAERHGMAQSPSVAPVRSADAGAVMQDLGQAAPRAARRGPVAQTPLEPAAASDRAALPLEPVAAPQPSGLRC